MLHPGCTLVIVAPQIVQLFPQILKCAAAVSYKYVVQEPSIEGLKGNMFLTILGVDTSKDFRPENHIYPVTAKPKRSLSFLWHNMAVGIPRIVYKTHPWVQTYGMVSAQSIRSVEARICARKSSMLQWQPISPRIQLMLYMLQWQFNSERKHFTNTAFVLQKHYHLVPTSLPFTS